MGRHESPPRRCARFGWYLLAAPPDCSKHNPKNSRLCASDDSQPFGRWYQLGEFDSATECRAQSDAISSGRIDSEAEKKGQAKFGAMWPKLKQLLSSEVPTRCIASDDPRLKEK